MKETSVLHFTKEDSKSRPIQKHTRFVALYIQGVPGGRDKTSGECSLC